MTIFRYARVRELSWLSTFYHAKFRNENWLYLSSCRSQGGELALYISSYQGEKVSLLYLSSCQSQRVELALYFSSYQGQKVSLRDGSVHFIFLGPERSVCCTFHHARISMVSWVCLSSCEGQEGTLALSFTIRVRKVNWLYIS